jgi:hypothetical protein
MYWNGEQGDDRTADGSVSFTYPRHHHRLHERRLIYTGRNGLHTSEHTAATHGGGRYRQKRQTIEKSISGK